MRKTVQRTLNSTRAISSAAVLLPLVVQALAGQTTQRDSSRWETAIRAFEAGDRTNPPPRNAVESTLQAVWQALFEVPQVGMHDNFFELGGDSIVSIQAVSRARKAFMRFCGSIHANKRAARWAIGRITRSLKGLDSSSSFRVTT